MSPKATTMSSKREHRNEACLRIRRGAVWAILLASFAISILLRFSHAAEAGPNILEAEIRYSGSRTGLTDRSTGSVSPVLGTNLLEVLAGDPESLSAVNALLFGGDTEDRFAARRALRLAWRPPPPVPPEVDSPHFNPIDQFIAAKWFEAGVPSALKAPELCDDTTFLRRVYLDVIGAIPTIEEAQSFINDSTQGKRVRMVEDLLNRDEDYAANWTPFWDEMLGNSFVSQLGLVPGHGNLRDWVFKSLEDNKPYDVMVSELIDPSMPGHRKVNARFVNGFDLSAGPVRLDARASAVQTAADVAQVFLGLNVKCAMCHNDPENPEWSQKRLLAFAGFFANQDLTLDGPEQADGLLVTTGFPFDIPGAPNTAPRDLDARLHRLTQLLVDPANPRFSRTVINRLWKRFFGLGLFEPDGDYRANNPSSHPKLLEWLANDLVKNNFNLKHVIRLILGSRTYQLQYDAELEDRFNSELPEVPRYFQSPSLRRLSAEQVVDSVRVATTQILEAEKRAYLDSASTPLTRALGRPSWHSPLAPFRPTSLGFGVSFEFMHGSGYWNLLSGETLVSNLAKTKDSLAAVERFYWATLSRPPTVEERQAGIDFLEATFSGEFKTASSETFVWSDDKVPAGSSVSGSAGEESWKWVSQPEFPVLTGGRAHTQGGAGMQRQHYFTDANPPMRVGPDDIIFVHVYFEPEHLPKEIMMQWSDGNWEHRAFWGEDLIRLGQSGSSSRRSMGSLPKSGEWVMLEVPARDVGIQIETTIFGWSFDQLDGTVYWDKAGVIRVRNVPPEEPLQDVLWALVSSPEFQFIW